MVAARDRRHRLQGAQPPPLEADDLTERKERSDPISCRAPCALRLATRELRQTSLPQSIFAASTLHPSTDSTPDAAFSC